VLDFQIDSPLERNIAVNICPAQCPIE
jgi:hypothetical protein